MQIASASKKHSVPDTESLPGEPMPEVLLLKDLALKSGHSIHTIKYYLNLGLIQEAGRSTETRFRYFNSRTLEQLHAIRRLQKQGKRLAEIKEILVAGG